jgi:hypothetical protein
MLRACALPRHFFSGGAVEACDLRGYQHNQLTYVTVVVGLWISNCLKCFLRK